ncbi:MAG: hypothetical protein RL677_456 [Actinomycetota bacterium]|jgi:glycerol uptake facilitator-like aquaporin
MTKTVRQIFFEGLGTYILLLAIVGSGIMATNLSDNFALALFINAAAIGATLFVLISVLDNLSGAYFNPAVVLYALVRKKISIELGIYLVLAQLIGGFLGAITANYTFGNQVFSIASNDRFSFPAFFAEIIATAGLIFIISKKKKFLPEASIATVVSLWIFGAIFFTSSTAFANPAVSFARIFSDSFTGISPISALWFVGAEIIAVVLVYFLNIVTKLKR